VQSPCCDSGNSAGAQGAWCRDGLRFASVVQVVKPLIACTHKSTHMYRTVIAGSLTLLMFGVQQQGCVCLLAGKQVTALMRSALQFRGLPLQMPTIAVPAAGLLITSRYPHCKSFRLEG
jgi:hypothetical protein